MDNLSGINLFFLFIMNVVLLAFLLYQFFKEKKITLHPYKGKAAVKESTSALQLLKWPLDYRLRYRKSYDERTDDNGVVLFAQSPDLKKRIVVFEFDNEASFQTFLTVYNERFPDVQIL